MSCSLVRRVCPGVPRWVTLAWVSLLSGFALPGCEARDKVLASDSAGGYEALVLPAELREASGLAALPDGSLLTHDDESAVLYRVDFGARKVSRFAAFGNPPRSGDFEGVAVLDETVFLLTSSGNLLARPLVGTNTDVVVHKTGLKRHCEFEGLAAQSRLKRLALLCKNVKKGKPRGGITLYFYSPAAGEVDHGATLRLAKAATGGRLHPSGVEWLEDEDAFLVVAAREQRVVQLDQLGTVSRIVPLPNHSKHPQAEGITVADSGVYIVDEAGSEGYGLISRYPAKRLLRGGD